MKVRNKRQNWKRQVQRQEEAKTRQELHDKLTVDEKLAKLDAGGFKAKRERFRLGMKELQKITDEQAKEDNEKA